MSKRKREIDVSVGKIDTDGFVSIEYQGNLYAWHVPLEIRLRPLNDQTRYMISVISTKEGLPMVDVVDLRKDQQVVCQVINPWHERYDGNWMLDN